MATPADALLPQLTPDAAATYGLLTRQSMPLVRGFAVPEALTLLENRRAADLFPLAASSEVALACLHLAAGAWDEAHRISQDLGSPEAAYCHGLVHRLEPDAANAKYWFRQARALNLVPKEQAADPSSFTDLCVRARGTAREPSVRDAQMAEWRELMLFCLRGPLL